MKLALPKLPTLLDDSSIVMMVNDGELENGRLQNETAVNCNVAALDLSSVAIEKVQFTGAQFSRVTMRDVRASHADFSSAHLDNGMIVRAEFMNCRMTGVDFSRTSLHDVVFRGCKLDLANFRFSDLRRVEFIDCTLNETDFMNAKLAYVECQSSTLEKTVFTQAVCKQVDLRSSELIDIAGWRDLKGAIIDSMQLVSAAPYLAQELGIHIRET